MLKRCFVLLWLGLCCLTGFACAAGAPSPMPVENTVSLADTGYRITVPDGWAISAQPDSHRAVAEATSAGGDMRIFAFLSWQKGWMLDDWQKALVKGSQTNGVTDIGGFWVDSRPWVGYRLTIDDTSVYAAATAIDDGLFLTLEFRAPSGVKPEAAFPSGVIEACLASLTAEP